MQHRIIYIDKLKGLAILLVVMGHVTRHCGLGMDNWIFQFIYAFHMPLFLFVSGQVCKSIENNHLMYLAKKGEQLMIPFFCWGVLAVLYLNKTYIDYLFDYFKLGYWYLPVLFLLYMCQIIKEYILTFVSRNKIIVELVLLFFLYISIRQSVRILNNDLCLLLCQDYLCKYYPYFFFGTLIAKYRDYINTEIILDLLLTIGLLLIIPIIYFWTNKVQFSYYCLPIIMITLLYSFFAKGNSNFTGIGNILSYMGKHTLIIYMFHFYLYKYVNFSPLLIQMYDNENYIPVLLIILLTSAVFITISIFVENLLSKSKLMSILLLGKK